VVALFAIDFTLGAMFWLDWALGGPSDQLYIWLNIDKVQTISTWYSSLQLFAEVGEMVGVTLLLWGTWDLLAAHGLSLRVEDPLRLASAPAPRREAVRG